MSTPTKAESKLGGPLNDLPFPVYCNYGFCGEGPFRNGIEVDEHVSEVHLCDAVWWFAHEFCTSHSKEHARAK